MNINPDLKHLVVSVSTLRPDPKNARKHDERSIDAIKRSLKEFGQQKPIVVLVDGTVIAGNGTLEAVKDLGWPGVAAVKFSDEKRARAYAVADNRTSELSTWDGPMLTDALRDINASDVFLEDVGFSDEDLRKLSGVDLDGDKDPVAEPDAELVADDAEPDSKPKQGITVKIFNDEEVLDAAFKHYRAAGFPYQDLSLPECMQEINRLASMPMSSLPRSVVAYGVADKFQRHRFEDGAEGMTSPMESWNLDKNLKYSLLSALRMNNDIGASSVRAMIQQSIGTQACRNFRPAFAAYMYRKFCPPGGVVLDTSTGYGGRLVGALGSAVVDHYIGVDPSPPTTAGNQRLLAFLKREDFATLIMKPAEDVDPAPFRGEVDFMFTSPPYFRKEHYASTGDDSTQSYKRYPEAESWRSGFLEPMLAMTFEALKRGGRCAINISEVQLGKVRYPLGDWTVEAGKRVGLKFSQLLEFPMPKHIWKVKALDQNEPIYVFEKP